MYATKRRRRSGKPTNVKTRDATKSNPSKRHRERLNSELEQLSSLLPFEQSIITKLDKLSVLRLAVSYLRVKSYFSAVLDERNSLDSELYHRLQQRIHNTSRLQLHCHDVTCSDTNSVLEVLGGFLLVVTSDCEVFFASHTVEQYLGFHHSDIIHQSILELIHSEDRETFKSQLSWWSQVAGESPDIAADQTLKLENSQQQQQPRCFTVRFRCLLDNASGFITLEVSGKMKTLAGQNSTDPRRQMALFALCRPFGPLPAVGVDNREFVFKTTHAMDMTPLSVDDRGQQLLGYSESEFSTKKGYDLIHPDDLNYYAAAHHELINTGSVGMIAYRLMANDLSWIWVQSSARVIYKNSKPEYIITTHRRLMEDDGRDLLLKRGSEFKLPFPIVDSEFEAAKRIEIKPTTKQNKAVASPDGDVRCSATAGGATCRKRTKTLSGRDSAAGDPKRCLIGPLYPNASPSLPVGADLRTELPPYPGTGSFVVDAGRVYPSMFDGLSAGGQQLSSWYPYYHPHHHHHHHVDGYGDHIRYGNVLTTSTPAIQSSTSLLSLGGGGPAGRDPTSIIDWQQQQQQQVRRHGLIDLDWQRSLGVDSPINREHPFSFVDATPTSMTTAAAAADKGGSPRLGGVGTASGNAWSATGADLPRRPEIVVVGHPSAAARSGDDGCRTVVGAVVDGLAVQTGTGNVSPAYVNGCQRASAIESPQCHLATADDTSAGFVRQVAGSVGGIATSVIRLPESHSQCKSVIETPASPPGVTVPVVNKSPSWFQSIGSTCGLYPSIRQGSLLFGEEAENVDAYYDERSLGAYFASRQFFGNTIACFENY